MTDEALVVFAIVVVTVAALLSLSYPAVGGPMIGGIAWTTAVVAFGQIESKSTLLAWVTAGFLVAAGVVAVLLGVGVIPSR